MGGLPRENKYGRYESEHYFVYSQAGIELKVKDLIEEVCGVGTTEEEALKRIDEDSGDLHGTLFQCELKSLIWMRDASKQSR
jgi:hypothetical protein